MKLSTAIVYVTYFALIFGCVFYLNSALPLVCLLLFKEVRETVEKNNGQN